MNQERVVDEWSIPDDLWEAIAPLIPKRVNTHPFGGGKPPTPDRICMEAILYVLRTGCQWKALNATRFCPGSTAHDRLQLWVEQGVFETLWEHGLMAYDDWKGIDWSWLSLDGCMTKAPLGGEKDGEKPHGSGQKRGQAQPVGRGRGHSGGLGRGGRQPPRHETDRGNLGEHSGRCRPSRSQHRATARVVLGQRV
jgi:putative transposase